MSIHDNLSHFNQPIWVEVSPFIWDGSDVATYPTTLALNDTVAAIQLSAQKYLKNLDGSYTVVAFPDAIFNIEAGELPPGLTLKDGVISGKIGVIPKGVTRYQAVIRITFPEGQISSDPETAAEQIADRTFDFKVLPTSLGHSWDPQWLSPLGRDNLPTGQTVYDLGKIKRGESIDLQLGILNPDNDPLTFMVVNAGSDFPVKPSYMPTGLIIDHLYRIIGVPNSTNPEGEYFFKIRVSDGQSTGSPATDSDAFVFKFTVEGTVVTAPKPSDEVNWLTNSFLGSTYENFASHFKITAENVGGLPITYELTPNSKPLPSGISLDAATGMLMGIMPFVTRTTDYVFTVRAKIGNSYTDRDFSLQIIKIYRSGQIANVFAAVNANQRADIALWTWATSLIPEDRFLRLSDPNWGRIRQPKMYLVNGLRVSPNFQDHLRDYHRAMNLRYGHLKTAKAYDPSGAYIYDMLYFEVIDPMQGAGGFTGFKEEVVTYKNGQAERKALPAIPTWNLVAGANNTRFHPNSVNNARLDLINTENRVNWEPWDPALNDLDPSTSQPPPTEPWMTQQTPTTRGVGLSNKEGMPYWMSCRQNPSDGLSVIGFVPAIELAYLKPGTGNMVLNSLINAGVEAKFSGLAFTVDRYLLTNITSITSSFDIGLVYDYDLQYLASDGQTEIVLHEVIMPNVKGLTVNGTVTAFTANSDRLVLSTPLVEDDVVVVSMTHTGLETTFDGPDQPIEPTEEYTTFDLITIPGAGKYYKFPPGDRKAG